jgi:hypothetical protein
MKYEKHEKHEMKDGMKDGMKKKDGGLKAVTLEGSGRACYPKLKKMNNKPY